MKRDEPVRRPVPVNDRSARHHVLALAIAALFQALAEKGHYSGILSLARFAAPSDHGHRGLLRACRERPSRSAADQRDEIAARLPANVRRSDAT